VVAPDGGLPTAIRNNLARAVSDSEARERDAERYS